MELIGYCAAILIGISLGLIGGGGSSLAVPVLVYLFHLTPQKAIPDSFFIVGLTSLFGAISYIRNGLICFKSVLVFGLPSVITVYLTHAKILSAIPEVLELPGGFHISKDMFVLVIFSILMIAASVSMIKPMKLENGDSNEHTNTSYPFIQMIFAGICIGFLAGLVGAGGGFLIIPALVLLPRLPMKKAIGTSLLLIAINSAIGFVSHIQTNPITDWRFLLLFSGLSICGIFVGMYFSRFVSGNKLKPAFGWFILILGSIIITQQIQHLH
jgi:uncharacterized membrane protein YfcA